MTVTETAPNRTDTAGDPTYEHDTAVSGFAAVLGSGDHKTVGRLYIVTSLFFLVITGVTGVLLGAERLDLGAPDDVLDSDVIAQVFSLHAVGGMFLFVLPLLTGLAMVVVPLQIGAATVAFPRAASASYWTFLVSGALVIASFAINGGPGGGDADGVDLFLVSMVVLVAALILATVCIVTTALTLRSPGMSLDRVPLFTWSNLVAGAVWLLTLPVLVGVLVILYVDHRYFREFTGGNAGIYDRIAWIFGQPSVYIFAIPVLGFVGDVVPVFASIRHARHRVAMFAIGAFGALSLGAWAQLGFAVDFTTTPDAPFVDEGPWLVFGVLALLPLLVLLGLWAMTMRDGRPSLSAPLIYGLAAGTVLLVAAAIGAVHPIEPLDLIGTSVATAQTHAVVGAVVLGFFGGITYWSSKILGRALPEVPSRLVATVIALGGVLLVVPDLIAGVLDQDDQDVVEVLNAVSLLGGAIVVLGALGFVGVLMAAAVSKVDPPDDPWQGHTLEWATASPPSVGNFESVPEITSEAPMYDARHRETQTS